jgi:hypothetical protein
MPCLMIVLVVGSGPQISSSSLRISSFSQMDTSTLSDTLNNMYINRRRCLSSLMNWQSKINQTICECFIDGGGDGEFKNRLMKKIKPT